MTMGIARLLAGVCVLAVSCACGYAGTDAQKGEKGNAYTLVLKTNESQFAATDIAVVLQAAPEQALSKGRIDFSLTLENHSQIKMAFRADALLDAMRISVDHNSDSAISLPANVRFRINAPVLPPRPYAIRGWRIVTALPDGTTAIRELPKTLLECNDMKALRAATVEIPEASKLILDFTMTALRKTTETPQGRKDEPLGIIEGVYSLNLSVLLCFPDSDSKKGVMQFGSAAPITITVLKDAGALPDTAAMKATQNRRSD